MSWVPRRGGTEANADDAASVPPKRESATAGPPEAQVSASGAERWLLPEHAQGTVAQERRLPAPEGGQEIKAAPPVWNDQGGSRGGLRRAVEVPVWGLILAATLLLCGVAAAALLADHRGSTKPARPASKRAAPSRTSSRAQPHPPRVAFVVDGVRLDVFDHPHGRSGGFRVRRGYRGVRLLILYRNLTRTDYDPNTLKYRLIDSKRHVYKPDPNFGVGPLLNQPSKAVARNVLGRTELAFSVRAAASDLKLLFRVKPKVGTLITVPLSPAS